MEASIQVRQRGTLTLPAALREKYGIKPGDTFRLVDLDGIFVLTPMAPMVPQALWHAQGSRTEPRGATDRSARAARAISPGTLWRRRNPMSPASSFRAG